MPVLPTNEMFYNPEIEELRRSYDPEKAAEILDELGYVDQSGDGIRQLPDGSDFEFVLTVGADGDHEDLAVLLRENMEKVGLRVHLNTLAFGLVFDQALAGDFEAMIMAFGNQPDPQLRKAIWQPGQRPLLLAPFYHG